MRIFPFILMLLFSVFSTAVMSYISMATPIGPWIAPTVILAALIVLKLVAYKEQSQALALISSGASVGGIIATACGFSYPTLYFLDSKLYDSWLSNPLFFATTLGLLALTASLLGFLGANFFENTLIDKQKLSFPIGQLIYKMITAGNQIKKSIELAIGFVLTAIFCMFQDGFAFIPSLIPRSIQIVPAISGAIITLPRVSFDLWPLLWSIGFVTGHVIAKPLAVGAFAKLFIVDPIHKLWFGYLTSIEFVLAFCSGMVLYGALVSFVSLPKLLHAGVSWLFENGNFWSKVSKNQKEKDFGRIFLASLFILLSGSFLFYFNFSPLSILFLWAAGFACMYQVAVIAGKFGIAPLGRFATFVMVPAMIAFQLDTIQIVFVATFIEISCGVIADLLFSRKMAQMLSLDRKSVLFYQFSGIVMSSLVVGIVFWLLTSHFVLGSQELLAYKSQSRQLLINAQQFNVYVLCIGALFSFLLKFIRVNPMLVLGGILMPLNFSIGLIFGGFLTKFVNDRQEWEPFWSGIFAANSIWMLIKALF